MKFLMNFLMVFQLALLTSCADLGTHKSCSSCHQAKSCKKGQCKVDKSCCGDKCGQCDGKTSCKRKQCDMTKKSSCNDKKQCDRKKKS